MENKIYMNELNFEELQKFLIITKSLEILFLMMFTSQTWIINYF